MGLADNAAIARVLVEIADLLELGEENLFKIRAYRSAADLVLQWPGRVADLTDAELRQWPGIGKDLSARIPEIAATGTCGLHQDLLRQFPATLPELLRLRGVGAKTVALLHRELGIGSLRDLEDAIRSGRLRTARGIGARKEQQIAEAIEIRRSRRGRHLLSDADKVAATLVPALQDQVPANEYAVAGSVRRGAEICGNLDLLAFGEDDSVLRALASYARVEQLLAQDAQTASVLLAGGLQVDLRLIPAAHRGAALIYHTGSRAHREGLRIAAAASGFRLDEQGLSRLGDGARVAGDSEADVYGALGLAWVPPELREGRGELDLAAAGQLPTLVDRADLRGDLHMHTTESDGKDSVEAMAVAARAAGLEYIAVTDHSRSLSLANGMDEARTLAHAARVRALNDQIPGITLLAGIECDVLPDGRMDLAEDCLRELDVVIASVHSALQQSEREMTARLLRAVEHPCVDIIGHPTSRRLLRREPAQIDMPRVIAAAAQRGVALEINGQAERMDLPEDHARLARDRGVALVISSDAHSTRALDLTRWSVNVARRAGLSARDILNTRPLPELRGALRRHRGTPAPT